MKVRKYWLLAVMMAQVVVTIVTPMLSPLAQPAYAAATPFQTVFYYPNDTVTPGAVEALVGAFNKLTNQGKSPDGTVAGPTYVDIQGGPFGSSPQQLSYDAGATDANSHGFAYALNNGQGYDCYVDGSGNPQLSIPNDQVYWHVDFDMYVSYDIGSSPPSFTYREGITKIDKIQGPNPTLEAQGGAGAAQQLDSKSQSDAQGLGTPAMSALNFPSACLPDPAYHSSHVFGDTHPLPSYYQNEAAWPNITANPGGVGGAAGGGSEDACDSAAVSLGWLLCPIIDLADATIQGIIQSVVIPELQVQPLVASSSDSQYQIWGNLRTLANVVFVLIFLVIIFANTLQFNLNAYTIKKVLPRLVAAVVLVQFSFILSAVVVDIGNILGQGVAGLVNVTIGTAGSGAQDGQGSTFFSLGGAFDVVGLLGIVAVIGIPTIFIALLTGLISVIGVLFTLIARRLVLIMLVIISPLAFAAWVLPGTEKYFNMWLKTFIRTVLMYPMIIFLLSAASIGNAAVASDHSHIESLLAVILPIIAFFMIPMTFKWAGSAMKGTAGFINNQTSRAKSSKPMQGLRKGAAEHQQRVNQNRAAGYQSTVFGRNVKGGRRLMTGLGRLGTGQVIPGSRAKSDIALAAQKAMAEESKRVESLNLGRKVLQALAQGKAIDADGNALTGDDKKTYDQHAALGKTWTGRAAVANQMAKGGDVTGLESFRARLAKDVSEKRLGSAQATQLWNGAKAGASSEIRKRDPIMAMSGWGDSEYMGPELQKKMAMQTGESIGGMAPDRLAKYAAAGATMTAGQLSSATSDKARDGKSQAHQDALLSMTQNGGAATDMDIQREHLIRYDYSSGVAVARNDTQVREIKRRLANDPSSNGAGSYGHRLDAAVHSIIHGGTPGGPPVPTSIPLV